MRLANAANFFEDTVLRDAYTNLGLFKGSVEVDGTSGSSTLSRRHALSLPVGVSLPARRTIKAHDEVWIIGDPVKEVFAGKPIRVSFMAARATDLFLAQSPGNAALGTTGGINVWGQNSYLKSTVNGPTDSEYDSQYECFFSTSELILKGTFLKNNGRIFHVRNTHKTIENFLVGECDQLDESSFVNIVFATGTYNPVLDVFGVGTTSTTGIMLDMYQLYSFATAAQPFDRAGDKSLVVSKSALTPEIGKTAQIAGRNWRIIAKTDYADAWVLHIRQA